ncbi:MAG: BatA domain-containing protein [Lysobacter sp.]
MTPVVLLPIALAALAALVLPLLIHLARRSEQRPTDFAALRWLRQKPKPRHRIRFDERLLLVLRLLLLALLALLLARPALYGAQNQTPWRVVVPGVDPAVAAADNESERSELHWLAPGFPRLDRAAPSSTQPVASLLRELDATLPPQVPLTVYVPRVLQGVDGARVQLSRAVQWRIVETAAAAGTASAPDVQPASIPQIRYAADRAAALPYLRAAVEAWRDPARSAGPAPQTIAAVGQPFDADARSLIWLAPGPVPPAVTQWVERGGRVLLDAQAQWPGTALKFDAPLWRDADGRSRVEAAGVGQGVVLRLTGPLTARDWPQLLQPGFAERLRLLFEPAPTPPQRVEAAAYAPSAGGPSFAAPPLDLRPWLALLIAMLFVLERWCASSARRGASP